ncbi:MAG: hypothetical protein IT561_02085 [Alphaproteobacteria bacterium]|nr:hypothetical protein [Alphaproteobacteria bacterium]
MAPRSIVVTGCDQRQVPLAHGLLQSMSRAGVHQRHAIGFIDAGIGDAQRAILPRSRVAIGKCDWDFDFPTRGELAENAPGLRTLVGKLRMRELFPGYDVYVWLDADTWVQDGRAVDTIVAAAGRHGLAAAFEIDRAYLQGRLDWRMWTKYQRWYQIAFPGDVGRYMDLKPMLNVGVYGIAGDAPHWAVWDWLYRAALARQTDVTTGAVFMSDQLSLNVAVHYHRLPMAVLPATFNWLCHLARPVWNPARRLLCEPAPPYEPLRIVHASGAAKSRPLRVAGLDGGTYIAPPRYPLRMRPVTAEDDEPAPEEAEA